MTTRPASLTALGRALSVLNGARNEGQFPGTLCRAFSAPCPACREHRLSLVALTAGRVHVRCGGSCSFGSVADALRDRGVGREWLCPLVDDMEGAE